MQALKLIALIAWLFIGVYDLTKEKGISKLDYALTWGALILSCISRLLP